MTFQEKDCIATVLTQAGVRMTWDEWQRLWDMIEHVMGKKGDNQCSVVTS